MLQLNVGCGSSSMADARSSSSRTLADQVSADALRQVTKDVIKAVSEESEKLQREMQILRQDVGAILGRLHLGGVAAKPRTAKRHDSGSRRLWKRSQPVLEEGIQLSDAESEMSSDSMMNDQVSETVEGSRVGTFAELESLRTATCPDLEELDADIRMVQAITCPELPSISELGKPPPHPHPARESTSTSSHLPCSPHLSPVREEGPSMSTSARGKRSEPAGELDTTRHHSNENPDDPPTFCSSTTEAVPHVALDVDDEDVSNLPGQPLPQAHSSAQSSSRVTLSGGDWRRLATAESLPELDQNTPLLLGSDSEESPGESSDAEGRAMQPACRRSKKLLTFPFIAVVEEEDPTELSPLVYSTSVGGSSATTSTREPSGSDHSGAASAAVKASGKEKKDWGVKKLMDKCTSMCSTVVQPSTKVTGYTAFSQHQQQPDFVDILRAPSAASSHEAPPPTAATPMRPAAGAAARPAAGTAAGARPPRGLPPSPQRRERRTPEDPRKVSRFALPSKRSRLRPRLHPCHERLLPITGQQPAPLRGGLRRCSFDEGLQRPSPVFGHPRRLVMPDSRNAPNSKTWRQSAIPQRIHIGPVHAGVGPSPRLDPAGCGSTSSCLVFVEKGLEHRRLDPAAFGSGHSCPLPTSKLLEPKRPYLAQHGEQPTSSRISDCSGGTSDAISVMPMCSESGHSNMTPCSRMSFSKRVPTCEALRAQCERELLQQVTHGEEVVPAWQGLEKMLVDTFIRACGIVPWTKRWPWASLLYQQLIVLCALGCTALFSIKAVSTGAEKGFSNSTAAMDVFLALGGLLGLAACTELRSSESLLGADHLLNAYAARSGLFATWGRCSCRDVAISFVVWGLVVAGRAYVTYSEDDDLAEYALHMLCFAFTTLLITGLSGVILHTCRGVMAAVDIFCCNIISQKDFVLVVREWSMVQATCRSVCKALQGCFAFLLIAAAVSMLAVVIDISSHHVVDLSALPGLVLISSLIRISIWAGAVTEKCAHVPLLVNSVPTQNELDGDRLHAVQYITFTQAGFYIFEIRLTNSTLLKAHYCLAVVAVAVATQLRETGGAWTWMY